MRQKPWRTGAIAVGLLAGWVGCAEGPLYHTGYLAPWSREQWVKDEAHGPTIHAKRRELTALRERASSMSPADAEATAAELITRYEKEGNAVVKIEQLMTIGALPGPRPAEFLEAVRKDSDPRVRELCCHLAAERARNGLAAPAVPKMLADLATSDQDTQVRLAALREMADVPGPETDGALATALDHTDPAIQFRAMRSLAARTGKDFGHDTRRWKEYLAGRPVEEVRTGWMDPLSIFR